MRKITIEITAWNDGSFRIDAKKVVGKEKGGRQRRTVAWASITYDRIHKFNVVRWTSAEGATSFSEDFPVIRTIVDRLCDILPSKVARLVAEIVMCCYTEGVG